MPMRQQGRQRIFVRQWRKHRGYSLEQVAERLHISKGALSRIERGERPYTQDFLEAVAEILSTDPASLLMRDPTDPDGIWSIWDEVPEMERGQALKVLAAFRRTDRKASGEK